jgi:hypothetical protein
MVAGWRLAAMATGEESDPTVPALFSVSAGENLTFHFNHIAVLTFILPGTPIFPMG